MIRTKRRNRDTNPVKGSLLLEQVIPQVCTCIFNKFMVCQCAFFKGPLNDNDPDKQSENNEQRTQSSKRKPTTRAGHSTGTMYVHVSLTCLWYMCILWMVTVMLLCVQ